METIHNLNRSISSKHVEIRVGLIIAGIAIAIICAMALMYEVRSTNSEALNPIHTSNVTLTDLPVRMMNKIVVSAIWPF